MTGIRTVRPVPCGSLARVAQVLIVGVARSGTTWVGQTLGRTQGVHYVHEPDGDHDAFAFRAVARLCRESGVATG